MRHKTFWARKLERILKYRCSNAYSHDVLYTAASIATSKLVDELHNQKKRN